LWQLIFCWVCPEHFGAPGMRRNKTGLVGRFNESRHNAALKRLAIIKLLRAFPFSESN
jgi:hypothetical protein